MAALWTAGSAVAGYRCRHAKLVAPGAVAFAFGGAYSGLRRDQSQVTRYGGLKAMK